MATQPLPSTIRAWRFHTGTGGAEKHMRLEDIPMPDFDDESLPPKSSLVKVLAVSLNPVDVKFASLPLVGSLVQSLPAIPGRDAAGIIVKTTDPALREGQLVACRLKEHKAPGVLAEYIIIPGPEGCAPVPVGVSPSQAATIGTCGITGLQGIAMKADTDRAATFQAKRVFINGGSGGTGTYQIQIAKALGFHVTTSCSAANAQLCRDLGADEVLDYRQVDVAATLAESVRSRSVPPFDLVLDNVGVSFALYRAANNYLRPDGVFVQVGISLSWSDITQGLWTLCRPAILGGGKRKWFFLRMETKRADMERVLQWMAQGKIKIPIDAEFDFHEAPQAYERLLGGRARGKIIVRLPALEEYEH